MIPSLLIVPEVSATVFTTTGNGFTVMMVEDVAVQPLAFVTVTVYVVVPAGVTLMVAVLPPVLQAYEVPPVPVRDAVAPAQIEPIMMVQIGRAHV